MRASNVVKWSRRNARRHGDAGSRGNAISAVIFLPTFFTASLTFAVTDADFFSVGDAREAKVKRNYFRALRARPPRCFRSVSRKSSTSAVVPLHRIFSAPSVPSAATACRFPRGRSILRKRIRAHRAHFRTACPPYLWFYGCSSRFKRRNEKERKRHPPLVSCSSSRRGRWNRDTRVCAYVRACVRSLARAGTSSRCNITYSLTTGYSGGSNPHDKPLVMV